MELQGIILAGGKSQRFGKDKGLEEFRNKKLVEYGIELLKEFTTEISINTSNSDYEQFGFPLLPDAIKNIGPIGGLHTVLNETNKDYCLVIPCDMPFLTNDILNELLEQCEATICTILATSEKHLIPTVGVYHISGLAIIEQQIAKKDYKLQNLAKALKANVMIVENNIAVKNINIRSDLL